MFNPAVTSWSLGDHKVSLSASHEDSAEDQVLGEFNKRAALVIRVLFAARIVSNDIIAASNKHHLHSDEVIGCQDTNVSKLRWTRMKGTKYKDDIDQEE